MPIGIINLANLTAVAAAAAIVAAHASAQNKYDPGASDTENHRTTGTGSISSARDSDGVTAIYPAKSFHAGR